MHQETPLSKVASNDQLGPKVWARKDQLQHASTRGGLMCAMYPDTNGRADLEPLYDGQTLWNACARAGEVERDKLRAKLLEMHERDKYRHNFWQCAVVELFGA